ncbi:MAG: hypothetical protein GC131_07645 [Alphaproteobacteria bacterium]|nr:hypothetical protein [Alphaproteobacteria bacterium]
MLDQTTLAPGSIHVLTGFSGTGKSTAGTDLLCAGAAEPARVKKLVEDRYYCDPRTLLQGMRRFAERKNRDLLRACYDAAHEQIMQDALFWARKHYAVLVDICPGQPDGFFALLQRTCIAARDQDGALRVIWLTCSRAARMQRIAGRGTWFDRTLAKLPGYLDAVEAIEERVEPWARTSGVPLQTVHTDKAGDGRSPERSPLFRMKNIPFFASLAASLHAGALRAAS